MSLSHTQDEPLSLHRQSSEEDIESCGADDDLKDPAEDSDCESGGSLDNHSDWAPLYRPHLSNHSNQPPLKAQQLSDTERVGPEDRGKKTRGGEKKNWFISVFKIFCHLFNGSN